jgi:precorrin-6Y C5,15-methyltransferase (decarboxylating)
MDDAWLSVVGIGEDGLDGLGARARALVAAAEAFVGGRRHLAFLGDDPRPRILWRSPLADTIEEIERRRGRTTVVLASGDPSWFGVARLLRAALPDVAIPVLPQASAFSLACAKLGWALEEVVTLSCHGRPIETLRRHLAPGARLLVLTDEESAPPRLCNLLAEAGLGGSRVTVLERLGGPGERCRSGTAMTLGDGPCDPLSLVAIEVERRHHPLASRCPGLPDELFASNGQLTKAEIRAVTLARLAPAGGELLWDVGAGAGSVAIEWLRAACPAQAVAVERRADRAERIARNARHLGVPELLIVTGEAPGCLATLPDPDAVFVGGGITAPEQLEACWQRLRPGGRLVANAVTIEAEAALLAFGTAHRGSLSRLQIARAEPLGGRLGWRPLMPVTQLVVVKSCVVAS